MGDVSGGGWGSLGSYLGQKRLMKQYFEAMEDFQENDPFRNFLIGQLGRGVEPYGGPLHAEASPLQQAAFSAIPAMGTSPSAVLRQGRADVLASGVPSFEASPEEYERFYQESIRAPAIREWQEETIPYIQHAFGSETQPGGSGEWLDRLAEAGVDLRTNLAAQEAQVRLRGLERYQDASEAAADRSIQAIPLSAMEETRPIRYALAGGDIQRGIRQDEITGEFYRWMMAQPWANPWFSMLGGGGGGGAFGFGGSQQTSNTGAGLQGIGSLLYG
jgi:hypothetical protein